MKVIIAGSRDVTEYQAVVKAILDSGIEVTTVVSGGARGVDRLGERYARETDLDLEIFKADWDTHGKRAGYLRNVEMSKNADALIAIWDGKSRGTKHMIDIATGRKLRVYVHRADRIKVRQ